MLIINTLCVMPKIDVFRHQMTIRRRILAVFMVRIAFLLTFFTAFMKRQEKYERNLAYAVVGTKPTLFE